MSFIPLSSILYLFAGIVTLACTTMAWKHAKKIGDHQASNRVPMFFLGGTLFVFLESLPCLLTANGYFIEATRIFNDAIILNTFTSLAFTPFNLLSGKKFFGTAGTIPVFLFSVFYGVYNLSHLKPSDPVVAGSFIVWHESASKTLLIIHSLIIISILAIMVFLFLKGWRHNQIFVRQRSRFMAIAYASVLIAGGAIYLGDFIAPPSMTSVIVASLTIASFFILCGTILALFGIRTNVPEEE